MGPDSFVLWTMRELGHEFAFSSESVEFLRGIHRLASLRRLWTFALNRRAIVILRGPRGGCHARQIDRATATVLRLIVNLTFADSAMAAGISDRLWSLEELVEQTS